MALLERGEELAAVAELMSAGGVLLIEGGAGIGKTALVEAACATALAQGSEVVRAQAAELEAGFAFGVVRQLFERRLLGSSHAEREQLLAGPAGAAWTLLGAPASTKRSDASFAIVHGLYWLATNLAASRRLLVAVDDAHWADRASLQWLGYLAPRADGLGLSVLVALRPADPGADPTALLEIRRQAAAVLRPRLLSEQAVACLARQALGERVDDELCSRLREVTGGNPFYLRELLTAGAAAGGSVVDWHAVTSEIARDVLRHLGARLRRLGPVAIQLARAVAVLGDGCALRQAAALAGQSPDEALHAASALVDGEVFADAAPPRFLHPILRDAVEASLNPSERTVLHRAAAAALGAERAPAGRVAAHLRLVPPADDTWVCGRLREAAAAALAAGAPQEAAELALARTSDPRERARIALEVAQTHAALFRWVDAVDVIERALAELGNTDPELTDELRAQLVVAGLHDARRAALVESDLSVLATRPGPVPPGEALAVARGMVALLAGRPAAEVATPLRQVLSTTSAPVPNWDTRAALLWCLVTADGVDAVDRSIGPMLEELGRTGSARGLIAVYSSLGFLKLRLGPLPEADTAAEVAERVMREGDFAPGLPFALAVRAEVAIEAGQLDEARALLELLPADPGPPGVGTVLVPAAWGRLHLAAGHPAAALAAFQTCATMFSAEVWGLDIRDVGYVHARSGAAAALLLVGDRDQARRLADAELADARRFGARRALGVALRSAGLAHGGGEGLDLLAESVAVLTESPAVLERAKSLAELGAAQRRSGHPAVARENLAEALDLAARCGAHPLAGRVRQELTAAGARPRRDRRRGAESLTPAELRVARLAAGARTNREIAQGLYVTVKTVEGHLARVYTKLGITGRAQLRAALDEEKTRVTNR